MNYTKNDNLDLIIKENELVIVDFFANWCSPCRMLSPILEEIGNEKGYKIVKIDVDEFDMLAQEFNITSIPRVLVFKKGVLSADVLGFLPKEALLAKING